MKVDEGNELTIRVPVRGPINSLSQGYLFDLHEKFRQIFKSGPRVRFNAVTSASAPQLRPLILDGPSQS